MIMTERLYKVGQNGLPIKSSLYAQPHTVVCGYQMHFLRGIK
jgi:hypothetical protein